MPSSEVFHKFKGHALHSGSKRGPLVKSRAQAIAIYLHERDNERATGRSDRKKPSRKKRVDAGSQE